MKKNVYRLLKTLFLVCIFFMYTNTFADVDVRLIVAGCNNDTVCQAQFGENINSCPNDCTYIAPTSTPATTTVPTSGSGSSGVVYGTGGNSVWKFENILITYSSDSVTLSWSTTRPTKSTVSWGLTDDYLEGTVSEIEYIKAHTSKITNIIPGKKYVFRITAQDASDSFAQYMDSFILKKDPVITLPTNVSNFRSFIVPTGIGLRWENPKDFEFSYIRIIRSAIGYPLNSSDGKVVYEGRGQSFVDIDVADDVIYYYAAFVKNAESQYSSGALLSAVKYKDGINPLDSNTGSPYPSEIFINPQELYDTEKLNIQDIDFIQDEKKISYIAPNILVNAELSLRVSIPRFNQSAVFLTLSPGGQMYLVGHNVHNGRLEVNLPPFETDQPIQYSLLIFKDGKFYRLHTGVFNTFLSGNQLEKAEKEKNTKRWQEVFIIFPIAIMLYFFMWLLARRKRKEKKD